SAAHAPLGGGVLWTAVHRGEPVDRRPRGGRAPPWPEYSRGMADLPIPVPDDDAQVAGLGAAVKAARKRLDLSIAELAQTAGVSLGFVSQLERGIGNPSLATISKLAAALGLTVSQLLEEPASDFAVVRAGARYSIPTDPRLPAAEQVVRELLTPRGESMLQVIRS